MIKKNVVGIAEAPGAHVFRSMHQSFLNLLPVVEGSEGKGRAAWSRLSLISLPSSMVDPCSGRRGGEDL